MTAPYRSHNLEPERFTESIMPSEMAEDHVYEVEKVLDKRDKNGFAEYKIKWKGFESPLFDTWEPVTHLGDCKQLLKQFEQLSSESVQPTNVSKEKKQTQKRAQELVKKSKQIKTKLSKDSEFRRDGKKLETKSKKTEKGAGTVPKTSTKSTKAKDKTASVSKKQKSKSVVDEGKSKSQNLVLKTHSASKDKIQSEKSVCKSASSEKSLLSKEKSLFGTKNKVKKGGKDSGSKVTALLRIIGAKTLGLESAKDSLKSQNGSSSGSTDSEVTFKGKKGVKRKLVEVDDSDLDSDDDILYSLNDVVIDIPYDKGDVGASGQVKAKLKDKNGDKNGASKSKSKVHGEEKAKKRLSLIDSMRKKKKLENPSESQSQSHGLMPFYTNVKQFRASAPVQGTSLTMSKFYGDVPAFSLSQSIMPISPSSISYKTLLDNLPAQLHPKKTTKRTVETESERERVERRISVRATEGAFRYKQIVVKKCSHYTQIWLNTQTRMKNAIDPQVVHEIVSALNSAKYDDSNLVLLSSIGNMFCSGIDLNFLLSGERRVAARQMVDAVRDLVKTFITFPKPIIAAVPGPAIGLGMAILPLCDVIYASDKALFYLPYSQLSQTPEGCASFTLPLAVGLAVSNELLFMGRKITAMEAYQLGLVSQVFWPTSVMQEVIPRVQHMSQYSAKALEATKLLVRSHHRTKLELTCETECNLLLERWSTVECQRAIETYLSDEKNFRL